MRISSYFTATVPSRVPSLPPPAPSFLVTSSDRMIKRNANTSLLASRFAFCTCPPRRTALGRPRAGRYSQRVCFFVVCLSRLYLPLRCSHDGPAHATMDASVRSTFYGTLQRQLSQFLGAYT